MTTTNEVTKARTNREVIQLAIDADDVCRILQIDADADAEQTMAERRLGSHICDAFKMDPGHWTQVLPISALPIITEACGAEIPWPTR